MPTTRAKKPAAAEPPALTLPQEMLDPNDLQPHPLNAKVHDDEWLRASVRGLGQFEPVTVNTRGGGYTILSGHGRIAAWKVERPGELIQATILDVDEPTALRILANSNPSKHDPGYDTRGLLELLTALQETPGGLDVTNWEPGDLDELIHELEGGDDDEDAGEGAEGSGGILDPGPDHYTQQWAVQVVCTGEDHQKKVYKTLLDMGMDCRVVSV